MELKRKKDLTSSISSIKGAAIQNLVTPSFESQLAGRASGVHYKRYWNPRRSSKVRIRELAPYLLEQILCILSMVCQSQGTMVLTLIQMH
jgi:hypothetical protein